MDVGFVAAGFLSHVHDDSPFPVFRPCSETGFAVIVRMIRTARDTSLYCFARVTPGAGQPVQYLGSLITYAASPMGLTSFENYSLCHH